MLSQVFSVGLQCMEVMRPLGVARATERFTVEETIDSSATDSHTEFTSGMNWEWVGHVQNIKQSSNIYYRKYSTVVLSMYRDGGGCLCTVIMVSSNKSDSFRGAQ